MSRIAVIEYTSLDGVIQGPGHAREDTDGGFQRGGSTGPFMAEHGHYMSAVFEAAGGSCSAAGPTTSGPRSGPR